MSEDNKNKKAKEDRKDCGEPAPSPQGGNDGSSDPPPKPDKPL